MVSRWGNPSNEIHSHPRKSCGDPLPGHLPNITAASRHGGRSLALRRIGRTPAFSARCSHGPAPLPAGRARTRSRAKKRTLRLTAAVLAFACVPAIAETPQVTLPDYALDFPAYGYDITVSGTTRNLSDKLTADSYITIIDEGYKLRTVIDRMSRKDRRGFSTFFNEHCIGFAHEGCDITATGEVELDDDMRMIFRIREASIRFNANEWTNGK